MTKSQDWWWRTYENDNKKLNLEETKSTGHKYATDYKETAQSIHKHYFDVRYALNAGLKHKIKHFFDPKLKFYF